MTLQEKFESSKKILGELQARQQQNMIQIERMIGRLQILEELIQEQDFATVANDSSQEVNDGGQE